SPEHQDGRGEIEQVRRIEGLVVAGNRAIRVAMTGPVPTPRRSSAAAAVLIGDPIRRISNHRIHFRQRGQNLAAVAEVQRGVADDDWLCHAAISLGLAVNTTPSSVAAYASTCRR